MIASIVVGLAGLAFMLATEPRMAIVWDEGYTLGREARLRAWFRALRDPAAFAADWSPLAQDVELVQQVGSAPPRPEQVNTRAKLLFDTRVLAYFWPFAREEPHGHPPFYALLGLVGDVLAPSWQELPRARLGPILLFCLTGGILFHALGRRWGPWAAAVGAGAWFLQPNLFAHGHYAAYDAVLSALWVLAVLAFARAVEPSVNEGRGPRLPWPMLGFALALGCALTTKLTGWFLPVPLAAWAIWTQRRQAFRALAIGIPLAVVVLFVLMPPWWTEPITGVVRFLQSNLSRGQTIPIPVRFLGTVYQTPNQSLPWYNTLIWTLLVTPVGFLLLANAGIYRAVRGRKIDPMGMLILANWIFLMALRSLPHTPGHDGVRLFLPAFGLLALLAGMGARQCQDWFGSRAHIAVVGALVEGIASVVLFLPVPLSYFSPLVGGLPGASRLGMEPTYYWDALGPEARDWLRTRTGPGETIQFATFPTSWLYLRQVGELPRRLAPIDPGRPVWYVIQNRPGDWRPMDQRLVESGQPAFEVWKLGVPLVWIYPFQEVERTLRMTDTGEPQK